MESSQSETLNSEKNKRHPGFIHYAPMLGFALVIGGILLFIDQRLHTGWIPIALPVVAGLIILAYGFYLRADGWLNAGFIVTGVAGAIFLVFQPFVRFDDKHLVAYGLLFFSLSWMGLFLANKLQAHKSHWWALFVILIAFALAVVFYLGNMTVLVFTLALSLAVGLSFLIWGMVTSKIGLQIPGLIISTVGVGVYNGWKSVGDVNGLRDTGVMLVWFSLGWLLITVFSRIFEKRFIWWPLIPGGILVMVGSGLYIGGNPSNATAFLQNTGSIALILLGVYLILLKFGLKK
jgi:hypothetical protein